ncbi:hypothetical protein LGM89_32545 [Burkholderia sp. AU31624]|uniref:hypothetical protein n=1 Tax=Burkholderia sp. AU31624 TaxID=2879629 RepID=UPI001CF4D423|nr:hypothetical protein [Burkholderia sp. AU31624]MCA8258017.1 hypothetical protein [Burkholderia sp. AU31624]
MVSLRSSSRATATAVSATAFAPDVIAIDANTDATAIRQGRCGSRSGNSDTHEEWKPAELRMLLQLFRIPIQYIGIGMPGGAFWMDALREKTAQSVSFLVIVLRPP